MIICMANLHLLYSQSLISEKGTFQVNTAIGCTPLTITTTDILGTQNAYCFVDCPVSDDCNTIPNPGEIEFEAINTFTYDEPGTYRIVKLANDSLGAPFIDCIFVDVLSFDTEPIVNIVTCS